LQGKDGVVVEASALRPVPNGEVLEVTAASVGLAVDVKWLGCWRQAIVAADVPPDPKLSGEVGVLLAGENQALWHIGYLKATTCNLM
jgi:hypothetical protein